MMEAVLNFRSVAVGGFIEPDGEFTVWVRPEHTFHGRRIVVDRDFLISGILVGVTPQNVPPISHCSFTFNPPLEACLPSKYITLRVKNTGARRAEFCARMYGEEYI